MAIVRRNRVGRTRRSYRRGGAVRRFVRPRGAGVGMMIQRPRLAARHYLKRTWTGTITLDASIGANPYFVGSLFKLDQLPNYTEYTNLFDNYKIHGIKMTFFRPSLANSATENDQQVRLHTVVDHDDASPPSTINEMLQYDSYKCVTMKDQFLRNGKVTRYFKPRVLTEIYRSSIATGYQPTTRGILDTQYNDVPHYALKWALEVSDSNGVPVTMPCDITLQYNITYYMSFGSQR